MDTVIVIASIAIAVLAVLFLIATYNRLVLGVRSAPGETSMTLSWLSVDEWRALLEQAGFRVEAVYGWFDRRPYSGGEDTVWVASRPRD